MHKQSLSVHLKNIGQKPCSSRDSIKMSDTVKLLSIGILCIALHASFTAAKVVVLFSVPHVANVRTHTNVGRALTKMGHEVYVCIPQFMIKRKVINTEGIKVIEYGESLGELDKTLTGKLLQAKWKNEDTGIWDKIEFVNKLNEVIRNILSDKILLDTLKSLNPDLFVLSNFPPFRGLVVLPYMLSVPFAYMSPLNDLISQRVPFSPSATACPVSSSYKQFNTSFFDRLSNFFCLSLISLGNIFFNDNSLVAEFAPHRPQVPIDDLTRQAEVYIIESDHILNYATPELPNVKLVGCTAPTPAKPLKEPFKSFVENTKSGLAVVTFGSAVVDLPDFVAEKMIKAFEQQNLQIVWRVNVTSPNPSKILTSRWVPQNDILAHSNTKLFVSHCGANGQYEALYHGVPILCLPLFGDQVFNAQRSHAKEYGITVDLMEISDKELAKFMNQVAETPKYRNNIQKASKLFRELFKLPVNEAAYWIDHVMEYGGAYMRSASQDMPWYQYLCLDILALIVVVEIIVALLIFSVCRSLFRRCVKSSASKNRDGKDKKE